MFVFCRESFFQRILNSSTGVTLPDLSMHTSAWKKIGLWFLKTRSQDCPSTSTQKTELVVLCRDRPHLLIQGGVFKAGSGSVGEVVKRIDGVKTHIFTMLIHNMMKYNTFVRLFITFILYVTIHISCQIRLKIIQQSNNRSIKWSTTSCEKSVKIFFHLKHMSVDILWFWCAEFEMKLENNCKAGITQYVPPEGRMNSWWRCGWSGFEWLHKSYAKSHPTMAASSNLK